MRHFVMASALVLAAACGQAEQDTSAPADIQVNMPAAQPSETNAERNEFPQRMAMNDLFEVRASELAAQRARSTAIREYAQEIVVVHTASTQSLRTALGDAAATAALPAALDSAHQSRLDALNGASAERFDELYIDQQIEAHENALTMLRDYAQNGQNTALKAFAEQTAPTVDQHLQRARQLDQSGADEATN